MYTPAAGFTGTDSFTYIVTDQAGAQTVVTANVTISSDGSPSVGKGSLPGTRVFTLNDGWQELDAWPPPAAPSWA